MSISGRRRWLCSLVPIPGKRLESNLGLTRQLGGVTQWVESVDFNCSLFFCEVELCPSDFYYLDLGWFLIVGLASAGVPMLKSWLFWCSEWTNDIGFVPCYSEEDIRRMPALQGHEYPSKPDLDAQPSHLLR
ncbi:hypothetical protein RHMOL_Rhmol07G0219800 [Rhododendron molle]|uniref:Uncharacterized protein n=1 Tax=Rhododendron molle TaxID=49168 RepID=A0ACC0N4K1_RHOML|nr:hypothetical protein RHMOL_Rhmol07G0219800 [Rhododendron molle]